MIAGVILAAGAGRRFGAIKQVALLDGEPLVRRACRTALAAGLSPVIVVVGAHAATVVAAVHDLPVRPLHNPHWQDGLSTSIHCAVHALAADPVISALALLLADQPLISAAHVRALCDHRRAAGADLAATRHAATLGPPAVFARCLFPSLATLTGDRGARDLIAASPRRVAIDLATDARDADTPDALAALARP